MPRADASAFGASRHISRNLESRVQRPNTSLVDTEDDEVFGGNRTDIRFVRNGESTTAKIVDAVGVELGERLAGARVVGGISG